MEDNLSVYSTGQYVGATERIVHSFEGDLLKIHFSIKSTAKYHNSRLILLLLSWFQAAPPTNVHIVTDMLDNVTDLLTSSSFNVHPSTCPAKHTHSALSCKAGVEFDVYYQKIAQDKQYSWYCHFDDDVYVNIPSLHKLLSSYSPEEPRYLGNLSINPNNRLPINLRSEASVRFKNLKRDTYFFATGAAYCISKVLMSELEPYLRGAMFEENARLLGRPDDMTIGIVIEGLLGYNLTIVPTMMSHLQWLPRIPSDQLAHQVTISYGERTVKGEARKNVIILPGPLTEAQDPTRFLSYHHQLYHSWTE